MKPATATSALPLAVSPTPRNAALPAARILGISLLILAAPVLVGLAGGNYWVRVLDFALLYVMLALGLNVVVGFAGLLDLGYVAFYAVGAYVAAFLSSPHLSNQFAWIAALAPGGLHLPFLVIAILAMALAAVFGVLLGAPTLRLRGDYLAIVTLGFGEIVRIFMNNLDRPLNITNGPRGILAIEPITLFGITASHPLQVLGFRFETVHVYYYIFLLSAVFIAFTCHRLQHSRIGRAWSAIREDEVAAKAMGIETRNIKLLAFAMGAAFGGLAGALFGRFQGFVSPESFTFWESVVVLVCVVLGGMGHIPGVVLGALIFALLPEALRETVGPLQLALLGKEVVDTEVVRQFLYGVAMVLIMLYRPRGLWPVPQHAGSAGNDRPPARAAAGDDAGRREQS
jgi:branched-chain amino acid transport system permease protein